jgi:hypothetical protein
VYSNTSNTDIAKQQRARIEEKIEDGRQMAVQTFETLARMTPKDYVVASNAMKFLPEPKVETGDPNGRLHVEFNDMDFGLHRHALNQVCGHIKVGQGAAKTTWPTKLTRALISEGAAGKELLCNSFNQLFERRKKSRFLIRSVTPYEASQEVRGWLTTRYRPVDSGPMIEALAAAVRNYGAVPIEARYCDTKVYVKFILPEVFEPVPGETLACGLSFSNSDFGNGAEEVRFFIMRTICVNGMMGDDVYRRVHLGKSLPEGLEFSNETVRLNTELSISAMKDIVRNALDPDYIDAKMAAIKAAAEEEIDASKKLQAMREASKISKEEMEGITDAYNKADVIELPQGNSAWRLANAISLFAKDVDPERALDLQVLAGSATKLMDN